MRKTYTSEELDEFPKELFLDKQKDIKLIIDINQNNELAYSILTENAQEDKLLRNIATLCNEKYNKEQRVINGIFKQDKDNKNLLRLQINKLKDIEIDLNNRIVSFPEIPNAEKVLMAQKEDAYLPKANYLAPENGIKTDLHSHYTAMLEPDKLVALGLKHNVDYHLYYIYTLGLDTEPNVEGIQESIFNSLKSLESSKSLSDEEITEKAKQIFEDLETNKGNIKKINSILPNEMKKSATIPFKDLVLKDGGKDNLKKILDSCCLSREHQSTFSDMTNTYNFRFPFTNGDGKGFNEEDIQQIINSENIPDDIKKLYQTMCEDTQNLDFAKNNLQDDSLLWIARNAQEEGIDYIEMSHNVLATAGNQSTLATYERNIDKLEQLTGVKLRFLAGVSRSTDEEKFPKVEANIKRALKSKYVVGFDVLGEEVNSTRKFEKLLDDMTQYALENDPDMVIRVHAGESYSFKDNVFKIIETVYGQYLEQVEKAENPLNVPKPNLRIGHGIHGLDEEMQKVDSDSKMGHIIKRLTELNVLDNKEKQTDDMSLLDFMSEMDVVIERCLTSNILLSHQNALGKDPLATYLAHNVRCVLATDGYGVYGTSSQMEVVLATTSGIGEKSLQKIRETEEYVKARSLEREERKVDDKETTINSTSHKVEQSQLNQTQTTQSQKDFLITNIDEFPQDRNAIVIAGGSYNTYDKSGEYTVSQVTDSDIEILEDILNVTNPQKDCLVIGGQLKGQELKLIELVNEKNKELQDKIEIILVTEQTQKLTDEQKQIIEESKIKVLESHQKEHLANYKKINDEIFSQGISADLIVLDGGQAAANLITDANKGKENHIFSKQNINEFMRDKLTAIDGVSFLSTEEIGKGTLEEQKDTAEKGNTQQQMYSLVRENRESINEYKGEEV